MNLFKVASVVSIGCGVMWLLHPTPAFATDTVSSIACPAITDDEDESGGIPIDGDEIINLPPSAQGFLGLPNSWVGEAKTSSRPLSISKRPSVAASAKRKTAVRVVKHSVKSPRRVSVKSPRRVS
jgi:hypothetical protein